ncbi:hypothetical protein C4D60_Mb08t32170 [Musa balbisiana]|uniref:Uncharacterized protein n=1 Tax=Musa balbisiana TaxID=52838 RepID=A0A4S8K858_MUSBA|nr:hypothetical protein C4D60_Mb08t32170 [Musa balbisiana]
MCRRRDCKLRLRVGISPNKAARSQQLPDPNREIISTNQETGSERGVTFVSAVGLPAKRLQPSDLFGLTNGRHWPFFLPTSHSPFSSQPCTAFQSMLSKPSADPLSPPLSSSPLASITNTPPHPTPPAFISYLSPLPHLSFPHTHPPHAV